MKPNLSSPKNYTVDWSKRSEPNSAVFKFFLSSQDKGKVKYWIPFLYRQQYYLMTFQNCYSVEIVK